MEPEITDSFHGEFELRSLLVLFLKSKGTKSLKKS